MENRDEKAAAETAEKAAQEEAAATPVSEE